ncbi:MAG TPA: flavodoxin, partial [Candidatus Atribacteria bacterium]|nr:flavodoxin [Candidatus Atribacteria bacterium]
KTIIPFCTHGGGGRGRIEKDIAKLCPQSTVMPVFAIYGSGGRDVESQVSAWLESLGFTS